MTTAIIITVCVLILLAYIFDITSSKTKVPSVILLLLMGWLVKQVALTTGLSLPNLSPILPILGTIGLILIVLEGSLELELNATKFPLIKKSFAVALLPMLLLAFGAAGAFHFWGGINFKDSLTNAIPLCVISSAIAIPSVKNLMNHQKEFIIYESSLSDILGVIFFNFVAFNDSFGAGSIWYFFAQLMTIIIVSFLATGGLSYLLSKIDHHIKFAPIILLVILIYNISKIYHLPSLVFILIFGLFLGNLDEIKRFKWIQRLKPDLLDREVKKFKEITIEATFVIRVLFFLLFGYLMETAEILNLSTLGWAVGIVINIFCLRAILLKFYKMELSPLLFIAPRGLITILLFLSIPASQTISLVNKSLIIQIIILSALVMMIGLMMGNKKESE
ncbi:cation:proton antiporter [Runella salmonicolor]|uniref:Cation:proton antiporter n=1 Tax=Runella salmonicolor TaxID=2950278 RepID=A0ABT1FVZ9_9BACT|nr:cation:proton antiporter [Runella salmonicolor]MCP1385944.1 cation:proton antiporter [Runella salmonicolor]